MPLTMVTHYEDITPDEIGILQRQFEKSPFYQNKLNTKPTKLAIFDFDSTLFFSPLLSPTLWDADLIRMATAEGVYGPGWWRDIRSLDLGPMDELKKTAWEGFWNEKVVSEARACIDDPNTMTVVLTGRRYHPFHQLIPAMLEAKKLSFDLVGLRPDPEHVSELHWRAKGGQRLTYNISNSVFSSTMHFKTCFILNILHNVSSIHKVVMWDDRIHHVYRFQEYLDELQKNQLITKSKVIHVPGIRPKYNPSWEYNVVQHIIETHNTAVMAYRNGAQSGKYEQRITWPVMEKVEDPLHEAPDVPLKLTSVPTSTIARLSKKDTDYLYELYKPILTKQQETWSGQDKGGEEMVYFGTGVCISRRLRHPIGSIGSHVKVTIEALSESSRLSCFLLQVDIKNDKFILPLWYKPSEYYELFKLKNMKWVPIEPLVLNCTIDYEYRYGVKETKRSIKRERIPEDDYPERKRTKT